MPVPADQPLDTDITIEGGIWSTLATTEKEWNGNLLGRSSKENPAFGTHGVILLQNVRRVSVKNLTVRQSRPFGLHLANAHEFTVENITLEEHRRDGVHVIFSPDLDCTVRNVRISGVHTRDAQSDLPIEQVAKVIVQKINPDYPKTTPKGGTGKGIWIR
jgi:polygalacturonase